MTLASAPLFDDERPKKSNPILKWIFRIVITIVTLFILMLIAMNAINGTGKTQKESIEGIIGDVFNGAAYIAEFKHFSALPYVSLLVEDITVLNPTDNNKLMMSLDGFTFHTGLFNVIFQRPIIRAFEVKNFYAAPGTIAEKAVILDHIEPLKDTNKMSIKGQYSKLPFMLEVEAEPLYEGYDLTYGFRILEEFPVTGQLGDYDISFTAHNTGRGLALKDVILQKENLTVLNGGAFIAGHKLRQLDLNVGKQHLKTDLNYSQNEHEKLNIDGAVTIKNLDLAHISDKDSELSQAIQAIETIATLINAPIDPLYADKTTKEKTARLLPEGFNLDLDLKFLTLKNQDATLGDISLPVALADGKLTINAISGALNGGKLVGDISLHEDLEGGLSYAHTLQLNQWDFGQLLTDMKVNYSDVTGKANIKSDVTAQAKTFDDLKNNLNGSTSLIIADAKMKSGIADKLMSGLITALLPDLSDDKFTTINCVMTRFTIQGGVAKAETLFADTERLQLVGEGQISLKDNVYDLKLTPENKKTTLLDIAPAIRITGPLNEPNISPDTLSLTTKLGGALLGTINPVLLAATLTDFSFSEQHSCNQFAPKLQETEQDIQPKLNEE